MLAGTDKDDPCDPNLECAACIAIRPPTPSPSPTAKPPSFEAVFAIAWLLAVAYLVVRRKKR